MRPIKKLFRDRPWPSLDVSLYAIPFLTGVLLLQAFHKNNNELGGKRRSDINAYFHSSLTHPSAYDTLPSDKMNLVMAKGESESFQVALEMEQVGRLDFSRKSANSLLNFSISEVARYNGALDVLLPLEGKSIVMEGKTLYLWITYEADRKLDAGIYTDELIIRSATGEIKLSFSVEVKDITIPVTPSIPITFGIYQKALTTSENMEEIIRKRKEYFELCFKNRLSPYLVNWGPPHKHLDIQSSPYNWDDPRTEEYIQDPRFAAIGLPYYDRSDEELEALYSTVDRLGLLDRSYVYFYDEPRSIEDHEKVLEHAERLSQIAPSLKIQLPVFCGLTSDSDNIFELFDFYREYPLIINTGYYPLQNNETRADKCLQMVHPNQEWWTYTCCGARPGFTHNTSPVGTRSMMWRSWKEQSQGFLYWAVNNYESIDPDIIPEWTKPGDGHLVYRGNEFGRDYPLSTIRLERFRDGEEDYELLRMIEQKLDRATALRRLKEVYPGPNQHTNSAAKVEAFRIEMFNLIAK